VRSRLYIGKVAHDRKLPKRNSFSYGLYYLYACLDELKELDDSLRWFAHNRAGLFSLHDKDHGPLDGSPLRPWMETQLAEAGIDLEGGPICLLAFPRVLGFKFYPVSWWYCFHADGTTRAVMAEVRNTFGEHHNYLLHDNGAPMDLAHGRPEVAKAFHVSPFIEMDARYVFHVGEPGDKLSISIYDYVKGPLLLVAAVSLRAEEITDGLLWKTLLRYGPMSARAWILIHLQAIRIVAKGIRYIPKPPAPPQETQK